MIQHMPGTIICFNHEQVCLYHNLFINQKQQISSPCSTVSRSSLYINCFRKSSLTCTTINSRELYLYEMCVRKSDTAELVPLSCMLTTNTKSLNCLSQWLGMFLNSERSLFPNFYLLKDFSLSNNNELLDVLKYIICDNSMPVVLTLLRLLNQQTLEQSSSYCFNAAAAKSLDSSNEIEIEACFELDLAEFMARKKSTSSAQQPGFIIHTCTSQLMREINKLCKFYDSYGNNFNF